MLLKIRLYEVSNVWGANSGRILFLKTAIRLLIFDKCKQLRLTEPRYIACNDPKFAAANICGIFTDWKCECKPPKFTINLHKLLTFNHGRCVWLSHLEKSIVMIILTLQKFVADHFPGYVSFASSAAIICQITIISKDSENIN